jgi:Zn-dependent metalloprotease
MTSKKIQISFVFCWLIFAISNAQIKNVALTNTNQKTTQKSTPGLNRVPIVFVDANQFSGKSATEIISEVLQLPIEYTFQKSSKKTVIEKTGEVHQRYNQYVNGVKIEFSEIITHTNINGKVVAFNGAYYMLGRINMIPSVNASTALNNAVQTMGVQTPMWEDKEMSVFAKYSKPEGELVVFEDRNEKANYHLAWKFDVFAKGQAIREIAYVDAHTGKLLFTNPIIKHTGDYGFENNHSEVISYVPNKNEVKEATYFSVIAIGYADTKYSGNNRQIETISVGGYSLLSKPNGVTIVTYDAHNAPASDSSLITSIYDPNNNNDWTAAEFPGKSQGELDAHWGTEQVYDYWSTVHGRNSFDDNGEPLVSLVHVDTDYDNAFWNGTYMSYGDGSSNGNEGNGKFDILTSLDICAHEVGHAIMDYTADLVYEREQGALNEGFSDVWAAAVEYYSKGTGPVTNPNPEVWLMGDEIDRRTGSVGLRSMSNPKEKGKPDTYQGDYWVPATVAEGCITPNKNTNDYCGVHTNSSVLNYWFYLTSVGGNGTNDNGDAYYVSAVGIDKASLIAFRTQNLYLTSTSDYADARVGAIQAAIDLYGDCSAEEQAVTNAWYAVGVGAEFSCSAFPQISFQNVIGTMTEGTDCGYVDVDVILDISIAATANANVSFLINGGTTAAPFLDFGIVNAGVTFPAGSTATQALTIRIFSDGFTEGDEKVVIDFNVNANGGNALVNNAANTFTLTIKDDDIMLFPKYNVTLLEEDFETVPIGWINADRDGDSFAWLVGSVEASHLSTNKLYSRSWDSTNGSLTPDNYIVTSPITIPSDLESVNLSYQVSPASLTGSYFQEYYTVYWATNISSFATIDASPQVKPGAYIPQAVVNENLDMSAYIGQTGYLVFRHHNCTDQEYIAIDNLLLLGLEATKIQTTVNLNTTNDSQPLERAGTIYTSDAATGNLMSNITNNQSDDYGCLAISVSRAGNGVQSYHGSLAPNLVMDKTFEVSSTLTTGGLGDTKFTFYFTEAEIAGWENLTGGLRANIVAGREVAGMITEISNVVVSAFGSNVGLTANFSDVRGTYYFGTSGVIINANNCPADPNEWDGANTNTWSLGFAPSNMNPTIIKGTYDTPINSNIDACILEIRGTLNVEANNYVKVDGDITVNGILNIANEGSLVQVNDNALVINNGTIEVFKTTPVATGNSFSILGSPMSATTRNGAFLANNVVMNHDTSLFNLDPDVTAEEGGNAEHFADAEGDNWLFMTGAAAINPAEGYLVGPTTQSVIDGSYDLVYNEGTLNNGIYQVLPVWNGSRDESPTILSNPYASAIDIVEFFNDNFILANNAYFWEHITAPDANYPGYRSKNWNMGDISLVDAFGVGVAASNDVTNTPPSQYIPSGQGFGVKINLDPATIGMFPFQFDNSQRVTGPNTGYRNQENSLEKLYIYLKNETYNLRSSMAISFTDQATNNYDEGYETKRLATPVSIYSVIDDHELVIQTRDIFTIDQVIPLGFRTMVEEEQTFTISLGTIEGDNISAATVYLQDTLLGIVTNLSEGSYTFTSNESNQKDRFVIVFAEEQLGNNDVCLEAI